MFLAVPRKIWNYFHPQSVPTLTRHAYRWEVLTAGTFPLAIGLLESGTIAMLAKKAFDVPPLMFAAITASPMFANLTSALWARLARGRSRVAFIVALKVLLMISLGAIALLPISVTGQVGLTLLIVFARCLVCGIVTTRASVWRMNYPRHARGRVTARLEVVAFLIMGSIQLLAAILLDIDENSFRIMYPVTAILALVGAWAYSHVRLRGERTLLLDEGVDPDAPESAFARFWPDRMRYRAHWQPARRAARIEAAAASQSEQARFKPTAAAPASPTPSGTAPGHASSISHPPSDISHRADHDIRPRATPARATMWSVLRDDPAYRQYMIWQFVAGLAFMSSEAVGLYMIAELTEPLGQSTQFDWLPIRLEYFVAIMLGASIPLLVEVWLVPVWARLLDHTHITAYRARQGGFWLAIQVFYLLGGVFGSLVLVALARVLVGIVRAGGRLAWQLGHHDFAGRANNHTYMAIHATLTGIRGATGPFIALALYTGWDAVELPGLRLTVPAFAGLGPGVFCFTGVLALVGTAGFAHMARQRPEKSAE